MYIKAEMGNYNPMDALATAAAAAEEAAEDVISKRLAEKTYGLYKSGINMLKKIIRNNGHADEYLDEDGEVKVPLPIPLIKQFFGTAQTFQNGRMKSHSAVGGYRSAIKELYKTKGVSQADTQALDEVMGKYMQGHQRVIQQKRLTGELPAKEGKAALSVHAYRHLVTLATEISYRANQLLFVTLYCLLCWNLGDRSISVGSLTYNH